MSPKRYAPDDIFDGDFTINESWERTIVESIDLLWSEGFEYHSAFMRRLAKEYIKLINSKGAASKN